jgi:hypothetical protein
MFKFHPPLLLMLSGAIWLLGGGFLLPLGLKLILQSSELNAFGEQCPLLQWISSYVGGVQNASILLIALSLYAGYLKGQKVLSKSVQRITSRLLSLPQPISLFKLYSFPYILLIASMISLGAVIRFFDTPIDIRGAIDIVIGCALIQGAMISFRQAIALRNQKMPTA